MTLNSKSVSDGYLISNRLYSFEETLLESKSKTNCDQIPTTIQEVEPFDPVEYWEAINDRDKRIETLYNQNEALCQEKMDQMQKNIALIQENEDLKHKITDMEQEHSESYQKYERNISNLERKLLGINEKLEKSTKLIESFEENSKILENLIHNCKNEGEISEETVDFQTNLEKNYEQMTIIETVNATVYKETMDSVRKTYEEKLEDLRLTYEEKLNSKKKFEENKEDLDQKIEKMNDICAQLNAFEEKAKNLGYSGIEEALEQNKLLWEEITSLRKTHETYKNENEQLHHELDSFVEKLDMKENDFKQTLQEKEKSFSADLIKIIEEKDHEIQTKTQEYQQKIKVLAGEAEKNKQNLNALQEKYEDSLKKMQKDTETIKKMKQSLDLNEKNYNEYLKEMKENKIKNVQVLRKIIGTFREMRKDLEEMKKGSQKNKKILENILITDIKKYFLDRFSSIKNEPQPPKDFLNISRNMTTVESECALDLRNTISLGFEKKSSNFFERNKKVSQKPVFEGDVQDFTEFLQPKENMSKQPSQKKEEKISQELKDLKDNFSLLQGEHMKIAEIVDDNIKGGQNNMKNEFILFNYFEKLFDRLSLSLQKENEIKSMIHILDEKLDRNYREPGFKTLEMEALKTKNLRLLQELQEKTEVLNQIQNERDEYKNTCKELQIQLEFKRMQSKYTKDTQETTNSNINPNSNKGNLGDVSEIYQKYLKSNKPTNLRQTEVPVKHSNATPRTPNGKDVNRTIAKIILDNQRTKNGKLNISKGSEDGGHY